MDALIFVAVFAAWAVYLIPKALHHHDDAARTRTVDRFSHTMRVLARREPVSRKQATLVVPRSAAAVEAASGTLGSAREAVMSPAPAPTRAEIRARREAARRATRRRRRVLALLLVSLAAVAGVAGFGLIAWWYVAIPGGLLLAWLLACRLMVRGERRSWDRLVTPAATGVEADPAADADADADAVTVTIPTAALAEAMRDPEMWDPVPVTLPTYVTKPAAQRAVRTIDLDSTGVWTSGHTEADSALARQADEAARAAREAEGKAGRAVGNAG